MYTLYVVMCKNKYLFHGLIRDGLCGKYQCSITTMYTRVLDVFRHGMTKDLTVAT